MLQVPVWYHGEIAAYALLDDDQTALATQKWYLHSAGYAYRAGPQRNGRRAQGAVYLHREVMGRPSGLVDHENRNPLDCQRHNLLVTDQSGNQRNRRGAARHSTTGVRGVFPAGRRFVARITVRGRIIRLGTYDTVDEAAAVVERASLEHGIRSAL